MRGSRCGLGGRRCGWRGFLDLVWEVFIIPERLPLCPEVEFWKNETIFGISGSFVFFEASIIKSLKTPFKAENGSNFLGGPSL